MARVRVKRDIFCHLRWLSLSPCLIDVRHAHSERKLLTCILNLQCVAFLALKETGLKHNFVQQAEKIKKNLESRILFQTAPMILDKFFCVNSAQVAAHNKCLSCLCYMHCLFDVEHRAVCFCCWRNKIREAPGTIWPDVTHNSIFHSQFPLITTDTSRILN